MQDGIDKDTFEDAPQKYSYKRYEHVGDIASLCLYLLSDASSWMNSSDIDIIGDEGTLIL